MSELERDSSSYGKPLLQIDDLKSLYSDRRGLLNILTKLYFMGMVGVKYSSKTDTIFIDLHSKLSDVVVFKVTDNGPCVFLPELLRPIAWNEYQVFRVTCDSVMMGCAPVFSNIKTKFYIQLMAAPCVIDKMHGASEMTMGVYEDADDSTSYEGIQIEKLMHEESSSYDCDNSSLKSTGAALSGGSLRALSDVGVTKRSLTAKVERKVASDDAVRLCMMNAAVCSSTFEDSVKILNDIVEQDVSDAC